MGRLLGAVSAIVSVAACAEPSRVTCGVAGAFPYFLFPFDGDFAHHIERVDVLDGAYVPPTPSVAPTRTSWSFGASFLTVPLRDSVYVARVVSRVHLVPSETGRCGPWEPAPVQPPLFARNAAVVDWTDLGDTIRLVDPDLARFEPGVTPVSEPTLAPIEGDASGLTLRTIHAVCERSCDAPDAWSTVRVTHRFDRWE